MRVESQVLPHALDPQWKRAYEVHAAVSRSAFMADDASALLSRICHQLVEIGEYRRAWIGICTGDTLHIAASAGASEAFLNALHAAWAERHYATDPCLAPLCQGEPMLCSASDADSLMAPVNPTTGAEPAVLLLPLIADDVLAGIMALYAPSARFDEVEQAFLMDLAATVVLGMQRHSARPEAPPPESVKDQALAACTDAIVLADLTARITYVNPSLIRLWGFPDEDAMLGMPLQAFWHHPEQAVGLMPALFAQGAWNGEFTAMRRDGTEFPVMLSARLIRDEGGHPVGIVGSFDEVTARTTPVIETERLTCLYAALSKVNLAIIQIDSRAALLSEVCHALVAYGKFRMAWVGWVDPDSREVDPIAICGDDTGYLQSIRIFADERPEGQGPTGTAIRTGQIYICNDYLADPHTALWQNAATRCGVRASIALPIRLRGAVVGALMVYANEVGFFGAQEVALLEETALNISYGLDALEHEEDRQQAEEALRLASVEWQTTFDAVQDAVWLLDGDFHVTRSNAAAKALFQLTEHDVQHCWERVHDSDFPHPSCPVMRMRRSLQREVAEVKIGVRWYEVAVDPVMDDTGQIARAVHLMRDITERKRAEQEMLRMSRLHSLGEMAGGIAHDFNNILTAIIGNIGLTQGALDVEIPSPVQHYLHDIEAAVLRARDLTHQLLTFAKSGAPTRETVLLSPIIRETVALALAGSNCRCTLELPEGLWPVHADMGQICQVMHNLLLNAIQAMPEGGDIRVTVANDIVPLETTWPIDPGSYLRVDVQDAGVGIPSTLLEKIFDPFFSTKPTGSGLGLSAVYSIMRGHDGYVSVHSTPGVGSTFSAYLPAHPEASVPPAAVTHPSTSTLPWRILVMDDEAAIADLLQRLLAQVGHTVTTVHASTDAIAAWMAARAQGCPFDLVILDLTISGGIGGKEVLAQLRQVDPAVRAVAISGYANNPIMAHWQEYGFAERLIKPFSIMDVLNAVSALQGCAPPPALAET